MGLTPALEAPTLSNQVGEGFFVSKGANAVELDARFSGIARLYGVAGLERLAAAKVCVVGIGGVGSWVVEALVRSGVGSITLIDMDDVCVSNTNRQLHALEGQIGRPKVEVMAERARLIHPACDVRTVSDFFTAKTAEKLLGEGEPYSYVVDAIDSVADKCLLLARCKALQIPVLTVGGAGGRRDPTQLVTSDLGKSAGDGLLRQVRRILRQEYGFPTTDAPWGITSVFSRERAVFPSPDGGVCDKPPEGTNLRLDCGSGFGTASFVTGAFGLVAASRVVMDLASSSASPQRSHSPQPPLTQGA